jgi:uncharacterized repeat protein (TIGR03803 family)
MEPVKHPPLTNRLLAPLIILILACNVLAGSQQESPLYSFRLSGNDGLDPIAGLVSDNLGNLYGTTPWGGIHHDGTIFELSPPSGEGALWSEAILSNFTGGTDGSNPSSPVILDSLGNLYGTTSSGGLTGVGCSSTGCGVVFELSPPSRQGGSWTYTVLYRFSSPGPYYPIGGMVLDETGNLYGTTKSGGAAGAGTVFELSPPVATGGAWTEKVIHSFAGGSDGSAPQSGVTLGKNHVLYGTTQAGGSSNNGTIFQLSPPSKPRAQWTKTTLYSFLGGNDGSGVDAGVVLDPQGNLYGTTVQGGGPAGVGTVFQLLRPPVQGGSWTEVILYAFQSDIGATPYDTPVLDHAGNLYGTTYQGGPHNKGTVFKLTPPAEKGEAWTFTTLHDFNGGGKSVNEGAFPFASLLAGADGSLYGTTSEGGTGSCQTDVYYGCGTVFRIAP